MAISNGSQGRKGISQLAKIRLGLMLLHNGNIQSCNGLALAATPLRIFSNQSIKHRIPWGMVNFVLPRFDWIQLLYVSTRMKEYYVGVLKNYTVVRD